MDSDILALATQLRHELHAHPELSNQEHWTKAHLMEFLRRHSQHLDIVDRGSWFYAAYRGGDSRPGIAFRADFDAVPVEDRCDVPYVSQFPGIGHKCGHDGHSAALAALALETDRHGAGRNVFFLFQHAEETGDGAAVCTELFQLESVGEIFGFHHRPGIPLGTVRVLDGTIYCASRGVILSFTGVPTHASTPELGKNPAYAIAELITALPGLTDPATHRGLVLATVIQVDVGEEAFGVQASRGRLLLTVRGQYPDEYDALEEAVESLAREKAAAYGLGLTIEYRDDFPATVSGKASNDKVRRAARDLDLPLVELDKPIRSSEDFGHYTEKIPGSFFELGSGEDMPGLHTEGLNFPDALIPVAVALNRRLIEIA